jgi:hypothetical protein
MPTVNWQLLPDQLDHVERRPRFNLMARFRMHFADGSSAAFSTPRRRNIQHLSQLIEAP